MMSKIVVANWKAYISSLEEARRLFNQLWIYAEQNKNLELVICPPFVYLSELLSIAGRGSLVKLGAQDVFYEEQGAHTGEISPEMLENLGVEYVIIGHSERRKLGETDEIINKKVSESLKEGLKIILCVGEPERHFRAEKHGLSEAENYIIKQLKNDLDNIPLPLVACPLSLIVAYEPIWAIGTDHPDTPEDAVEMIKFIKQFLNARYFIADPKVLYGGSVDSGNIKNFIEKREIDGALVGHASTDKKEFEKILKNIR